MRCPWAVAVAALLGAAGPAQGAGELLDGFDNPALWSGSSYPGASLALAPDSGLDGGALRLDFDFRGARGYVLARRPLRRTLPDNWALSFYLRAATPPNTLEVKIVDPSGENVWWWRQRDYAFPLGWERITIRKGQLRFAWGPAGGGEPTEIGALEIAVTATNGGRGSLWIEDLRIEERERIDLEALQPSARGSEDEPGRAAVDRDPTTAWRPPTSTEPRWLQIDLGRRVEYGGLVIDWDGASAARAFRVQTSDDAQSWVSRYEVVGAGGARSWIPLPEGESRYLRLELLATPRGRGYGIREVTLQPDSFSDGPNALLSAVARSSPRGHYPRHLIGEQGYWTAIGTDGDAREGLLGEDGALEVDKGRFSVEPFLHADGELVTWANAETRQELEEGDLPIPSVLWQRGEVELRTTAFAAGAPGKASLYARYRVTNRGVLTRRIALYLAIRPFQVNPPWQSLNMQGGYAPIGELARAGRAVRVDRDKAVVSLTPPDAFGAAAFDAGALPDWLARGALPEEQAVVDPRGLASGAFRYDLELAPGAERDVWLAIPFRPSPTDPAIGGGLDEGGAARRLEETRRFWRERLARIAIQLPGNADDLVRTARTTVAYMFVNRDGPALQPGSRDYERAWIRDGALSSAALLEMGYSEEVREFLRWYATYQYEDGRIPCCVDGRGPDPVEEHDSNGAFIYAVTDYWRYTHDREFLAEMWPHVVKAVAYIGFLRSQHEHRDGELPVHGLAPPSISHEGYSSHPVHSYWDDFFLLRGLKDAVLIAREIGDAVHAASFRRLRDQFRRDLYASIGGAVQRHNIDFIPGSVELGDFDPTSTSIAISPAGELENLPQPALARTFERYFEYFLQRRSGAVDWQAYTPYELRNVGTLIRLGRKDLALDALDYFLADRRPLAWHAWPEVVWRERRHPGFLGDMPHTWVGAGFLRSFRSLLVYENEVEDTLVIGAGIPHAWVATPPGVEVKDLPTWYGPISFTLRAEERGRVRLHVEGRLHTAPKAIRLASPYVEPLTGVVLNGAPLARFEPGGIRVTALPAEVEFRYDEPEAAAAAGN